MSQNSQNMVQEFSIKKLFTNTDSYLIPRYQRNYAWGESEVKQLAMDIEDYANKSENNSYYIGTLVVFKREDGSFETIDGQQRLTTLSIMLSVLKYELKMDNISFNHLLKYESRKISTETLKYMYDGNLEKQEKLNPSIENAYKVLKNYFRNNKIDKKRFKEYLLKYVKILRVEVPKDTDLNHYFEIMNNRGEQLEKHEVLKAGFLSKLKNDNDKKIFNLIWEACSDMNRYVQYGFSTDLRDKVFGKNWNSFECKNYKEIFVDSLTPKNTVETYSNSTKQDDNESCNFTIDDIINDECKMENVIGKTNKHDEEKPDRFLSPINFQNFLLHVYKITKDIAAPLDDKRLLDIIVYNDKEDVKLFGYNLLKMRFLFDKYVIKRDYNGGEEEWSLKQAYKYTYEKKKQKSIQYNNSFGDKNKQIIMILSMFHVSNPSQIYKYWLAGVLKYLNDEYSCNNQIKADEYLSYLEELANKFFKRYLSVNLIDYNDIIFLPCSFSFVIDVNVLNKGTAVEHFIFNYLDYLLWEGNEKDKKRDFSYYIFSFSNSVEHFYPQHPIDGHPSLSDEDGLNNFGNLCLISVNKNAKLNNHPPVSKKAYYPDGKYDSLKQHIMMIDETKVKNWEKETIQEHKNEMFKILGLT